MSTTRVVARRITMVKIHIMMPMRLRVDILLKSTQSFESGKRFQSFDQK